MRYSWLQPTLERMSDLLKMPDLHNAYGCAKVSPETAFVAINFFVTNALPEDQAPILTPTPQGEIHAEFQRLRETVTMVFRPEGVVILSAKAKAS